MELVNLIAIIITISALFSYINHKFFGLPTTIGVMAIALVCSLSLIIFGSLGLNELEKEALKVVSSVDFNETLMQGMLSFLLFAGALHVNINDLLKQKWIIAILATAGVVASAFTIGTLSWYIFKIFGINLEFIYCLLFGALISPTDPIAVLGILKKAGIPKSLETKVVGESLFNDGVGVVVFLVVLEIATSTHSVTFSDAAKLLVVEAVGGALFGFAAGYIAYRMLKSVNEYKVEILITLALVMGGYGLAAYLHLSGPIAVVIAGLFIGNRGRAHAMSDESRENLDVFWELVDEILNVVLFILIGVEILILQFETGYLLSGLLIIPAVLLVRFIVVKIPVTLLDKFRDFSPNAVKIMTWGALRGGISVALALSIPEGPEREVILSITYLVVLFSILVQGLTVSKLAS